MTAPKSWTAIDSWEIGKTSYSGVIIKYKSEYGKVLDKAIFLILAQFPIGNFSLDKLQT